MEQNRTDRIKIGTERIKSGTEKQNRMEKKEENTAIQARSG